MSPQMGEVTTVDINALIAAHAAVPDAHHARYTDTEAVAARLHALPFAIPKPTANVIFRKEGEYFVVETTAAGIYPSLSTGYAIVNQDDANRRLKIRATVKIDPTDKGCFLLFAEPYKGDYPNFLGFRWVIPDKLRMLTRLAGGEEVTDYVVADITGDHTYEIYYKDTEVRFLFDDTVRAIHNTNISSPPHTWAACEPDGTIMSCYLKYPGFEVVAPS